MELTVERLDQLVSRERLTIVTGSHLLDGIREVLPSLADENLIVEPSARNTLPCIALAAQILRVRDPAAVLGVFPADAFIGDTEAFLEACKLGYQAARTGRIATIGIRPTRPETGYGYIHYEPGDTPVRPVEAFVEKPDRETAEAYLADGNYLWNAGIFFLTPAKLESELNRQRPELALAYAVMGDALEFGDIEGAERAFESLEAISFDYAVMEHARNVAVIPASFEWNDVGQWGALADVMETDDDGNIVQGGACVIDSRDSIVVQREGSERFLAVVGVEGLIVVETADATLILPKEQAQRVKEIVAWLKERGRDDKL
jgi:mannose-1-phosphate guanylyltransferase